MRVLLVGNHYRPAGGAERMVVVTERLLLAAGHDVAVLALDEPATAACDGSAVRRSWPQPAGAGARTEVGRRVAGSWSMRAAAATHDVVATWRPDVAHVHHVYEGLTLSVVDALHRRGVPVVMTAHDYRAVCPNYRLFRSGRPCERCLRGGRVRNVALLRCLEGPWVRSAAAAAEVALATTKHVYDRVTAFVAPSGYLRDRLVDGGVPAQRVTVVPNPVEPAAPRTAPPAEPRFVFAGRLVDEKGIDVLLDAAALLPSGVTVDVYGDGRLSAHARDRVARERLPVALRGRVAADGVPDVLRAATAIVLPALWPENCPLSLLEAAACAVPAVTTRVGGIPEIVADGVTGVLVEPGDAAALAGAMAALAHDDALAERLGAAARARASSAHAPESYVERVVDVLDDAVTAGRDRGTVARVPARARRT